MSMEAQKWSNTHQALRLLLCQLKYNIGLYTSCNVSLVWRRWSHDNWGQWKYLGMAMHMIASCMKDSLPGLLTSTKRSGRLSRLFTKFMTFASAMNAPTFLLHAYDDELQMIKDAVRPTKQSYRLEEDHLNSDLHYNPFKLHYDHVIETARRTPPKGVWGTKDQNHSHYQT